MSELAITRTGIAPHRINAMVLRYWYLLMSSWPRLLELLYWPALQIITWGFPAELHLAVVGVLRAGRRHADRRGDSVGRPVPRPLGFSISFLEEMWARNLGNLMMSPLKPIEFL